MNEFRNCLGGNTKFSHYFMIIFLLIGSVFITAPLNIFQDTTWTS